MHGIFVCVGLKYHNRNTVPLLSQHVHLFLVHFCFFSKILLNYLLYNIRETVLQFTVMHD